MSAVFQTMGSFNMAGTTSWGSWGDGRAHNVIKLRQRIQDLYIRNDIGVFHVKKHQKELTLNPKCAAALAIA